MRIPPAPRTNVYGEVYHASNLCRAHNRIGCRCRLRVISCRGEHWTARQLYPQ